MNDKFSNMNIMITGGLGFIGSNLAIILVEFGANLTVVDAKIPDTGWNIRNIAPIKNKINLVESNINNPDLKDIIRKTELIFNLAGVLSHIDSMTDPVHDLQINTVDQLKFLTTCLNVNPEVNLIYTGTRNQYGRIKQLPTTEDHPFNPIDANGISEIAAEMYHQMYWKTKKLKSTSLRLCNVFGPRHQMRHSRQGVLNWFIRQIMDGETVKLMGTGEQIRDCIYVSDAVSALLSLAVAGDKVWGEAFNIGGYQLSLREFVTTAIDVHGSGEFGLVPFPPERVEIEPGNYIADWSKLHKFTGWQPKTDFNSALKETFDYYQREKIYYW